MGGSSKCGICQNKRVAKKGIICNACIPNANDEQLAEHTTVVTKYKADRAAYRARPEQKAKTSAYNVQYRASQLAEGLCTQGCRRPVVEGTIRCVEHTLAHNAATRELHAVNAAGQKAAGLCIDHTCPNPPMEGRARCAEHQERHQVYGRIFVSLEEQKENLQPCSRRGCPEARFDAYKYCKDHYEERTEDMHLYGLKWRARETSLDLLANQRQRQKENQLGHGRMAISLFEAFDLKHDYLMKKLKGYALPSSTALYIDTEIVESSEGSQPRNVHEWTILSHSQGKQVWFQRRINKGFVPEETTKEWAMDLAACVDGCMIVQYGHAKPEDNRLNALFQLLPDYAKLPSFRSFEPMGTLLPHIFSRDPEDEFDPKAKVYVPDWALTYIVRRLNKVYSDDLTSFEEYEPAWDWNVWGGWSESGLTGKSVPDCVYLHHLIEALRHLQSGGYFHSSFGIHEMHDKTLVKEDKGEGSSKRIKLA